MMVRMLFFWGAVWWGFRAGAASYGVQYGGHFFFNQAIGAERITNLYEEKGKLFFSGVDFKLGLGSSADNGAIVVPFVFAAKMLNLGHFGVEVSQGLTFAKYKENMGFLSGVCLGVPVEIGKFKITPESCILTSTLLFNDMGLGASYEF